MVKNSPNLRDFRIDAARETSDQSSTDSNSQQKAPTQSVSARVGSSIKSSVSEWGSQSWQGKDRGDLWQVWEEDEEFQKEAQSSTPPANHGAMRQSSAESTSKRLTISSTNAQPSLPKNPSKQAPLVEPEASTATSSSSQVSGFLAWPAELALEERKMERLGVVDFSNSFKKADLLKRLTREFVKNLRESFQRELEVFNSVRQSQSHFVHLYRVSNTEEDFMLFRNGVKLVISGERSGHVVLAFNQFLGQIFTPSQQQPNFELDATWGAFDQIHWNYRGERVTINDIVRYFLGEFARQSYK
jgi:hypothetical protein